ncbi:GMC oxidoreductase [Rhodopseudomonas sp. RCAM05734]|uniref:GMC oxidoreductase n=1 Tax=Rhodopseudomonas sp. RCAM05734 TaxID=3457549 RepID=UPI004044D80C
MDYDVIIVGTGPAGVSAAFPLLQAGRKVLMIDAGGGDDAPDPPRGDYLSLRATDRTQWNWLAGADYYAIKSAHATSPKLRIPNLAGTFAGFNEANRVVCENFTSIGSLASGGLSNAWGAGVARFDAGELAAFPFAPADLDAGFAAVARRIGLSGSNADDLSGYFGLDDLATEPLPLDTNCTLLFDRYRRRRAGVIQTGLRIGRARLALLTQDKGSRLGCDHTGLCLWGCHRGAIYSARYDLAELRKYPNLTHRTGLVVERLSQDASGWLVQAVERKTGTPRSISAGKVVLAAGTISTSGIALRSLGRVGQPLRLLSNPTAAFVLILPGRIGRPVTPGHNMAQLMASVDGVSEFGNVHCGLFAASHLPAREFVNRFPLSRAVALDLWRMLMPATAVGNCFLPGGHSSHSLTLQSDDRIMIRGSAGGTLDAAMRGLRRVLAKGFGKLGGIIPPGGFLPGSPGSDIHYAGTLPMKADGGIGTTRPSGELVGLPGVHVADAACLPVLPAKPHTLTMMANAHRIGADLASRTG